MGEERKIKHTCAGCRYYDAYYLKGSSAFYREKSGFCGQRQKAVCGKDCCDLYKYRPHKEKVVTLEHIDEVIADIKELEKIFYNCNF